MQSIENFVAQTRSLFNSRTRPLGSAWRIDTPCFGISLFIPGRPGDGAYNSYFVESVNTTLCIGIKNKAFGYIIEIDNPVDYDANNSLKLGEATEVRRYEVDDFEKFLENYKEGDIKWREMNADKVAIFKKPTGWNQNVFSHEK